MLKEAKDSGFLPDGARLVKWARSDRPFVENVIVDGNDSYLGSSTDSIEQAVNRASISYLSHQPYSDLSLEQFKRITTPIYVSSSKGPGVLFESSHEQQKLRDILSVAYDFQNKMDSDFIKEGPDWILKNMDKDYNEKKSNWLNKAMSDITEHAGKGDVSSFRSTGSGHLLFIKDRNVKFNDQLIEHLYTSYMNEVEDEERTNPERPRG